MPSQVLRETASLSWFALRVKPNHEKSVSELMRIQGYEEFLPTYRIRCRRAQRWHDLELALFGGYIFCRFDRTSWPRIINTPGVIDVVRAGRTLAPVDEQEIEALQIVQRSTVEVQPWPYLQVGQPVRITAGPLAGRPGSVVTLKGSTRLVLLMTLLQRSVLVEIDRDSITYDLTPALKTSDAA